jgi:glycosyltransferase involved in cell wall biosynthesis
VRVLFVVHNHPALQPGGTETFSLALFRTLRERFGAEGLFLAGVVEALRPRKPGTVVQAAGDAPDELLVSLDRFDRFLLSQHDSFGLASIRPLVERLAPDVIHFHHVLQFGVEAVDLLRRAAPRARMVATLHDYFLICPREGQLLTVDDRLCAGPSVTRCRKCFPDRTGADIALRDASARDAFRAFDTLIAPSAFLRDRFVAAGWDPARITVVENGTAATAVVPHRVAPDGRRDRFAVFGNINRFKGTLVALRASAQLSATGVAHGLAIHGAAAWQTDAFLTELDAAFAAAPAAARHGPYEPAGYAARIAEADWVVVPSIWYENAPLVILEAFRHRRPVICAGIGGMAELVSDGVDGLHTRSGDPNSLAAVMRRAVEEPGLWDRLVARMRPPVDIDVVAARHLALYGCASRLTPDPGSSPNV